MANNLDGIKKLNPEEIKKNRKIVLNYIGEKDAALTKEPGPKNRPVAVVSNRVDGVRLNKMPRQSAPTVGYNGKASPVGSFKLPARARLSAGASNQAIEREKIEPAELIKKEIAEKVKRQAEEKAKAEELAKKETALRAKLEAEEQAKAEAAKRRQEKLKLEEKLKEEKRIARENERLAEIKRAEEIKRIKEEVKAAELKAAAKRKIKRQKAIKLFKKNLYNGLNRIFTVIKENLVYGALYLVVFLIIIYAVFCLLVLRFKVDNNIIAKLARVLPVPAAITSQGIINYNDWRDLNLANKKNSLAGWAVLKNLSGKYGLPADSPAETLALAFTRDENFNQAGLLRIKKIKELLKNDDNLEKLSKYADEFSGAAYYDDKSAAEKFGPAILNLNDNQLSDIIFRDNGYYIAQIVARENGRLGVKYIFVGATKTLEQYLNEKTAKIKIFILAN